MISHGNGQFAKLLREVESLDSHLADAVRSERTRASYDASASYYSGQSSRLNPVPSGVNPMGADADEHHPSDRNYYLIAERGRHAVRNSGLVESGINRLSANIGTSDFSLDSDTGDSGLDAELKAKWREWSEDKRACDYEGVRTFGEISDQSFFSQVQCGEITHLPLVSGHIQSWESHHIRNPYGGGEQRIAGTLSLGIERIKGRVQAVWISDAGVKFREITGSPLAPQFRMTGGGERTSRRYSIEDAAGNVQVFRLGFLSRFWQSRGISRLSPPRESMNGFERLNYSNIHSSVKRSLISYLMSSQGFGGDVPGKPLDASIPSGGARYAQSVSYVDGSGNSIVDTANIETPEGPAQVIKPPDGWNLQGWNANLPPQAFFEHASLLLTILAVNLDLPLMYLLLDGSKVNFHGGRMITDQIRMRFRKFQKSQVDGLWTPAYRWKIRQWTTPGSPHFDSSLARFANRQGIDVLAHQFRSKGWPYVKPLEDIMADRAAVEGRIRSLKRVLAKYGIDIEDHIKEVIEGEVAFAEAAADAAVKFAAGHPELNIDARVMFLRILDGSQSSKFQLNLTGTIGEGDTVQEVPSAVPNDK